MIACFLKKVHDQNQRKIGKKYGVLVMYFKCDMCYKIIKELETHDYRREGESNGAGISLYLMGNGPALDYRASGYWDSY